MNLSSYLPQSEGYLKWFLLWGVFSGATHAVTTYTSPIKSMVPFRGPKAPPPTQLQAHIYGVKNFYTVLIRLYAAYTLHEQNRATYYLAMWTFAGVLFLYVTETFVFRTVTLRDAAVPLVYCPVGLVWMGREMDFYLAEYK